ncbi:1850_t:CDS:1, partial [Rhizophagus irregularis]
VIKAVEAKASNIASVFLELIKMAIAIKSISNSLNSDLENNAL